MLGRFGFAEIEQMLNQHAKGCSPVADVIFANHIVANKREHAY